MSVDSVLDRLCAKCGIEGEYSDIWGQRRLAPESTKLHLLRAMGVDIKNAEGATAILAEIEDREWRKPFPAVKTARAGDAPPRLNLSLPDVRAADTYNWLLTLESGERKAGTLRPEAFHALESRVVRGVPYTRRAFDLPFVPGPGYHAFSLVEPGSGALVASTQVIVCPPRCFQPQVLADSGRIWGPAVQLYALRSSRNWGIGDLEDLRLLVEMAGHAGAGIVGVNPLHALFPDRPEEASPYRPSNRTRRNVLSLAVEAIPDFAECPAARERFGAPQFQARLNALRAAELVDYSGVAAAKFEVLELLYQHFREAHLARATPRTTAFRDFQAAGGESLRLHALFEALQSHFSGIDSAAWGWPAWPKAYRSPSSDAATAFAREHPERIEYFQYLQWQCELQLAAVAERS